MRCSTPQRYFPPASRPRPTNGVAWVIARRAGARCAAFTLLELTVVILLMAIMAAVIVPEMRGSYGDALLRSSSRDLVDVCSLAYSRAVSFNQTHRVRFELGSGKYVLERRVSGGRAGSYAPVRDLAGASGRIDSRIRVSVRSPGELPEEPAPGAEPPGSALGAPEGSEEDAGRPPGRMEAVAFYPDGTADERQIELRDREGFGIAVRIHPITARVQVKSLQRE